MNIIMYDKMYYKYYKNIKMESDSYCLNLRLSLEY